MSNDAVTLLLQRVDKLEKIIYGTPPEPIDAASFPEPPKLDDIISANKEPHTALFVFKSIIKSTLEATHKTGFNSESIVNSLEVFRKNYKEVIETSGSHYLLSLLQRLMQDAIEEDDRNSTMSQTFGVYGYIYAIVSTWPGSYSTTPKSLVDTNVRFYDLQTELLEERSKNEFVQHKLNQLKAKLETIKELLP